MGDEYSPWLRSGLAEALVRADEADVFLSSAREDQAAAFKIAEFLKSRGFTVFWDISIRNGTDWRKAIEAKLEGVKCILVLWSVSSVASEWVHEEADFGRSRQILISARLDSTKLPFGFARIQVADLSMWKDVSLAQAMADVVARISEIAGETEEPLDRRAKDERIRLEQRRAQTEHVSVSDHEKDRDAILAALIGQPPEVEAAIIHGYQALAAAQHAALYISNERVPLAHYASAAEHFATALAIIGNQKHREVRDGRSVEYFLSMERANCLVFCEQTRTAPREPIDEAIDIYTQLSLHKRYSQDVPVHFRLGCALVRKPRSEERLSRAIRALRKARSLATAKSAQDWAPNQSLVEGQWMRAELARQLGFCNYLMSEMPGIARHRRARYFRDAIQETREAVQTPPPPADPNFLFGFTILKAKGNLLFLLAQQVREEKGSDASLEEIRRLIRELKSPDIWGIVENQIYIIDDIAYAAATIGEWDIALEEAERNIENFASLAITHGLEGEEKAMEARAKEVAFFAKRMRGASTCSFRGGGKA
jgi:hypothetical protein